MNSPKCKFRGQIDFLKPLKGIGSVVSFSADSVAQLKAYAGIYKDKNGTLKIMENKKQYPEFEWVTI